jgi:hypothetical protein
MCEPISMMMMAMGASSLISASGSLQEGQASEGAAAYNAAVARQSAQASVDKAAYDEEMHRERVRKLISSQRAAYGASGVDIEGSPLLLLEDTAAQGEMDALAIRYGGEVEASQKRSQAELYELQGKNAKKASYYKAGSSLLSGGASIAKTYSDSKNPYYGKWTA